MSKKLLVSWLSSARATDSLSEITPKKRRNTMLENPLESVDAHHAASISPVKVAVLEAVATLEAR